MTEERTAPAVTARRVARGAEPTSGLTTLWNDTYRGVWAKAGSGDEAASTQQVCAQGRATPQP